MSKQQRAGDKDFYQKAATSDSWTSQILTLQLLDSRGTRLFNHFHQLSFTEQGNVKFIRFFQFSRPHLVSRQQEIEL